MPARPTQPTGAAQARELTSRREQVDSVRVLLERFKPQIQTALPKHLTPDRMLRLVMTCVANEPKLLDCTRESLIGAVIQLSQLGLEPGVLGHAYLLPFRDNKTGTMKVNLIPGYKGLLKLARNSGQILNVQAHVVYKQDHFEYAFGLTPRLEHVPAEDGKRDPKDLRYAYAIVGIKGASEPQWDVMNRSEVLESRRSSRAGDSGPWVTHEAEMWKKTVLRRICKLLPSSVELQTAIALDEAADVGIPQGFDTIDINAEVSEPSSNSDDEGGSNAPE